MIGNGELFEQSVLLEKFESEMDKYVFSQDLTVFEDIKFPFLEIVDNFQYGCPLSGINIDDLP